MIAIPFSHSFFTLSVSLTNSSILCTALGIALLITVFMVYALFDISSGYYLKAFCRKNTGEKLVALTFDDGPHSEHTPRVLDILKKYNVKATFFVTGKCVTGNEQIMQRIQTEGHQAGNHSFSHQNSFPLFPARKMKADMLRCNQEIHRTTGCKTEWFRPPFGITNPTVSRVVKNLGYRVAGWSIRSLDTVKSDSSKITRRIISRLHPGAIILLHDHLQKTPVVLEQVIRQSRANGYTFVTVEQLFGAQGEHSRTPQSRRPSSALQLSTARSENGAAHPAHR